MFPRSRYGSVHPVGPCRVSLGRGARQPRPDVQSRAPTSIADPRLPALPRQHFDRLDSPILQRRPRIGRRVARQVAVDQRHRSMRRVLATLYDLESGSTRPARACSEVERRLVAAAFAHGVGKSGSPPPPPAISESSSQPPGARTRRNLAVERPLVAMFIDTFIEYASSNVASTNGIASASPVSKRARSSSLASA
jgi:hypothetical protein